MTVLREKLVRLEQLGARMLPEVQRFRAWWKASLLSWLPERWQATLGVSDALLLLSPRDGGVEVLHLQHGHRRTLTSLPGPLDAKTLESAISAREANLPRFALLPANAVLRRHLRLPATATGRLHDMLRFEIDRQTPFTADQVYFDAHLLGYLDDGQLEAELVVAPCRIVDGLLSPHDAWHDQIDGVDVLMDDGLPLGVNLLPRTRRRQRREPMRGLNRLLLLTALVMLVLAGRQFLENRRNAATHLTAQVEAAAVRARAVSVQRQQLQDFVDGHQFFARQRAQKPTATAIINELSLRLGDGTWLEKLSIEGNRMQMIGMSSSASSLVSQLESASLWKTPALTGVVQSGNGGTPERFTLIAELQDQQ